MQSFFINYYQDEDGIFTAEVPAIKGCIASGETLEEVYKNACDAIESCVEARQKIANQKTYKNPYGSINQYELAYA